MILVTGATGTIGRPLVDLLVGQGAKVRAITNNPQADGLPAGVEVVVGDLSRPNTLSSSLRDVTSLFVHPRAVGDGARELVALARKEGVKRVVVQSAMNVDDDLSMQPSRFNGDKNKEVEEAVTRSDLNWVSLRPSSFATNAIGLWAIQIRAGDVVRGPYAAYAWAPIDPTDIAGVAAHLLLSDELRGMRIVLTGPQSLTNEESVAIIGDVIGRQLRYEEIPAEVARQGMIRSGLREAFVNAYLGMMARDTGQPAITTNEVEKILDHPALTFAQWVADHADAFKASEAWPNLSGLHRELAALTNPHIHLNLNDTPYYSPLTSLLGLTGPIDAKQAHSIVKAYTLAFFDRHLKGRPAALLDGPAKQYPEVLFEKHQP